MYQRCIFCRRPFATNETVEPVPVGRRHAFDPERGRLWIVCEHCRRWNLAPLEDRAEAVDALERLVTDRGRLVSHTDNVALVQAAELTLVRVGRAGLAEQAWWRYGQRLLRRRTEFDSRFARISAYTYGAMARLGESIGVVERGPTLSWYDTPLADMMRWWHFGWAVWSGRVRCPSCGSVLRVLPFDLSWWLYPLPGAGPVGLSVGVPCQRCDPWTPDKVYTLEGLHAEFVLRRVLAYQHIAGASEPVIRDAAKLILEAGSADAYMDRIADARASLWKLGHTRAIALEIALNEDAEQRMLDLEVRDLDAAWRAEEPLARIIDEELSEPPRWLPDLRSSRILAAPPRQPRRRGEP